MPSNISSQGHRKRLREKFLKSGLAGFHGYEIIELLLTLGTPRRDCKEQAKEAMTKFKTLRGVLDASHVELQQIKGIGPHSVFGLKLVQEVAREYLKEKILDKPVYKSAKEIFDFLYHSMRDLKKEVFKVIYLNSQNQILEVEDLFTGTVNSSVVSPREVMESAIRYGAVAMIFVHNHPSGDPEPSNSDRALTRELVFAAGVMQITVLDHIIIGDNRYYSFAREGMIEEYHMSFLNWRLKGPAKARRASQTKQPDAGIFDSIDR
jgi:DNA repair protein RadC